MPERGEGPSKRCIPGKGEEKEKLKTSGKAFAGHHHIFGAKKEKKKGQNLQKNQSSRRERAKQKSFTGAEDGIKKGKDNPVVGNSGGSGGSLALGDGGRK